MDLNPQAKQMADESMVRNLDAQIRAIWPQEVPLIQRYGLAKDLRILDAGCGTGEATVRLAELFPKASLVGVDIIDPHLALARARSTPFGSRVRFEHQTVFGLEFPDASFDLTVCRHVIHAIPQPDRVLGELVRVTRPGGRLHLIPEDYGMLHFQPAAVDPREFWDEAPRKFGAATATDLFMGRNTFEILDGLGLQDITVDYIVVDTLRVPRPIFAAILEAWRDGYAGSVAEYTRFSREEAIAYFNQMIGDVRNPHRYAVWMVPVIACRRPL